MRNRAMCKGNKKCAQCAGHRRSAAIMNVGKMKQVGSVKYFVVPIIMAKADVVMNGGLLPADEYKPDTWEGMPVTMGHPEVKGDDFPSARRLDVQADWAVGTLQNVKASDTDLRAEAWINVELCENMQPGLIKDLANGEIIDVSTGYTCTLVHETGKLNGVEYHEVHTELVPDHLALLPEEVGACSVADGCGVRSNTRRKRMDAAKVLNFLAEALGVKSPTPARNSEEGKKPTAEKVKRAQRKPVKKANEGETPKDETPEDGAINADAILAMEGTPYGEDDRAMLEKMSPEAMARLAAALKQEEPSGDEDEQANADADAADNDDEEGDTVNSRTPALNAEDREALAFSRKAFREHRSGLIATIGQSSSLSASVLNTMTMPQLEALAKDAKTNQSGNVSYIGRAGARANQGEADEGAKVMNSSGSLTDVLKARGKKEVA